MAEEFQGGFLSCAENWWNLPNNLFDSSPHSFETNDVASFDWSNHDSIITALQPKGSPDYSAGFSSSASLEDNSNQDFLHDKSEDNYSNMNNFGGNIFKQQAINTVERLSGGLVPLDSASYVYSSSLLQTLFDTDEHDNNLNHNNYLNYDEINITNELLFHNNNNHLHFTNNEPAATCIGADNKKRDFQNVLVKNKNEGANKARDEPAIKRARIQTPSSLPTFKVRKEKLGDRVTALQQLVSPFGKTDTASVLHEAIEYIKYLHDQVGVFSGPYLKNKSTPLQNLQTGDEVKQDLKSRGLCLVPISSTFPVTEIATDYWAPIFGDSFK